MTSTSNELPSASIAQLSVSSQPTVTVEDTQEQADGMYQSTIPIIELSGPHGHKRSMSDGMPSLPIPESISTVENKKSSSLQDVHQGLQDVHQDQGVHQDNQDVS